MTRRFVEGSEAIVEAAILAGCRFFAGYPMTPFTEVLDHMAEKLPLAGGVCINAESELEAVGMTWGALATGARAATGSVGQGLSLMQESFSEITRAELPLVVFNMARGQSDYYQSTRGGGHGDYFHIVLCPIDIHEAIEHVQLAFHLADTWRNPVQIYGDYLLAHTAEAVELERIAYGDLPAKDWAVDGALNGTGRSRNINSIGMSTGAKGIDPEGFWKRLQRKYEDIKLKEARHEAEFLDDADYVVTAFGTTAKFVRHVVREMRADGRRIGYIRPVTLWPFPAQAFRDAAKGAREIGVFELNGGQMIDDVRLSVLGLAPVVSLGGISSDESGFGVGPLLNTAIIRMILEEAYARETAQ
jgi:2-oxoglutarate/2-oxoacid ferredoxin oxidoreductase subunit alpha